MSVFYYPVSNYLNKTCRVHFNDRTSKEGYLSKAISEGYSYKIAYENGCTLFNTIDIMNIEILYVHNENQGGR